MFRSRGALTVIMSQAPNNLGADGHRKGGSHTLAGPGSCCIPTRQLWRSGETVHQELFFFFKQKSNRSSLYNPWELWASINKTKQKILQVLQLRVTAEP